MAKILVAILTCHRLDYYINDLTVEYNKSRCLDQQARVNTIRNTWVKDLGDIDYKFFYGTKLRRLDVKPNQRPSSIKPAPPLREPLPDEVFLDCGDGYTSNPEKMKAICSWALEHGYDFILRVDDDTFIYPRLFKTDFESYDYSGSSTKDFHPGGCMFLSRRAMQLIVSAPITTYADDVWIGQVMRDNNVPMHSILSIHNLFGDEYNVVPSKLPVEELSAFHSCKPEAMVELYEHGKAKVQATSAIASTANQ